MYEIFFINFGSMFTLFTGYKFAVNHLTKEYRGLFDGLIRICIIIGIISGSLLMPIWLQKSRYPETNIGVFLIGFYVGMFLVGITLWFEKQGKLKWPKEK